MIARRKYKDESGFDCDVPATEGLYQSCGRTNDKQTKNKKILAFIVTETDIKVVKTIASLLKDQIMKAFDACYYTIIHPGEHLDYSDVTLSKILHHHKKTF